MRFTTHQISGELLKNDNLDIKESVKGTTCLLLWYLHKHTYLERDIIFEMFIKGNCSSDS